MKKLLIPLLFLLIVAREGHSASATGGIILTNSGYRIHYFENSGSFVVSGEGTLNCRILIVGGGGGGDNYPDLSGGGGGGGGVIQTNPMPIIAGIYTVTIGNGGGPAANGGNSVFGSLTAIGGGAGGGIGGGHTGGSGGGGGGGGVYNGGSGTIGQGNDGGDSYWNGTQAAQASGGGGGKAGGGANATSQNGGQGGDGIEDDILGFSDWYGGGGGGGAYAVGGGGLNGLGGGVGGDRENNGTDGIAHTGGGGGGSGVAMTPGSGGSGVVVVRYPILPSKPITPSPSSNAVNQATNITLSWANGGDTTSYNVYFGESGNMTLKGNQAETTYATSGVIYNQAYQWRIDAVNAQGITTGNVWNFSTTNPVPRIAVSPSPINNAVQQTLTPTFSWDDGGAGTAAASTNYQVFWGLSGNITNSHITNGLTFSPGTLSGISIYQWKVVSFNAYGVITGNLWSFSTEGTLSSIVTNGSYIIYTFTTNGIFSLPQVPVVCDFLIVSGGGGGGHGKYSGGGGGAGGFLTNYGYVLTNMLTSVIIGQGGLGGTGGNIGENGSNSYFGTNFSIGGGGGGGGQTGTNTGGNGGSGGGGGGQLGDFGTGVTGQGNRGGYSNTGGGGGGGGAGVEGGMALSYNGGNGGGGKQSDISMESSYYSGGGGGGAWYGIGSRSGGMGGTGGGGTGGGVEGTTTNVATSGTINTGGGGGGGGSDSLIYSASGNGGSGIVIVRYDRNQFLSFRKICGKSNIRSVNGGLSPKVWGK